MQAEDTADRQETPMSNGARPDTSQQGGEDAPGAFVSDEVTAALTKEVADLKDKYVRVFAEMENMRRRQERERADLLKYSLESVFKDFLPVLDSLDKALPELDQAEPDVKDINAASYYSGMIMVKRQFLEVCRKHGLDQIKAKGVVFDPNVHQAIQRVESVDIQAETVGEEYARGYVLNGRLLRPAMVSVLAPVGS